MAYNSYKTLARTAASKKILRDKASQIASDPEHDGYQREIASLIYYFINKKEDKNGSKTAINKLIN